MLKQLSVFASYPHRRRRIALAAFAAAVILPAPAIAWGEFNDKTATQWVMSASVQESASNVATVATSWGVPSGASGVRILDTEIYSSSGERVAQWYVWRDTAKRDQFKPSFKWYLSSVADGTYTVKQGLFESNWQQTIAWNNASTTVTVADHHVVGATAETTTTTTAAPAAEPTTAPSAPVPAAVAPAAPAVSASGNPLAGATFYGPNNGAASQAAALAGSDPGAAALLSRLASVPTATWLTSGSGDVSSIVSGVVNAAQGKVPMFVAYNVPDRDCGSYSAGGAGNESTYSAWINGIANGIGSSRAVVILEPDALAQLCGDSSARYRMLSNAVSVLERNPGTATYLDAGHSNWIDANTMVERLRQANVAGADGFAVNVSNYETTAASAAYGEAISAALGGKHYVIDTSRNGNGSNGQWCNPTGRAVGAAPTTSTGTPHGDAFLWLKVPGESDGSCNGGPGAGTFWTEYAVNLARSAWG